MKVTQFHKTVFKSETKREKLLFGPGTRIQDLHYCHTAVHTDAITAVLLLLV